MAIPNNNPIVSTTPSAIIIVGTIVLTASPSKVNTGSVASSAKKVEII